MKDQVCRRCGIGLDTDDDGNCAVCAPLPDKLVEELKKSRKKKTLHELNRETKDSTLGRPQTIHALLDAIVDRLEPIDVTTLEEDYKKHVEVKRWNFQGVSDEELLCRYKNRLLQLQDHAIEGAEIIRRMRMAKAAGQP